MHVDIRHTEDIYKSSAFNTYGQDFINGNTVYVCLQLILFENSFFTVLLIIIIIIITLLKINYLEHLYFIDQVVSYCDVYICL